jgi:pyruvate dehydrogenase E1 component
VYAAYHAAVNNEGSPTVILARTIKGYGLGEAGEGRNVTHQQKKLNEDELLEFRDRFFIPISVDEVGKAPLYRPPDDSPEVQYIRERRRALGGALPMRRSQFCSIEVPGDDVFGEFAEGTDGREASTTMAFVRLLTKMLRDDGIGKMIVPIVPDEARTFGMEALFRQTGIYSHVGQLYEPVDAGNLLYYRESKDGQILEEGITEAGSMSSFVAAGTSSDTHGVCTLPIFILYSMFGLQRTGDIVWAAADARTRGFLVGATSGRTTLNGEGLQHQDGHSHVLASVVPNLVSYDPAFAYEIAEIVRDGIRRMHVEHESVFYYLTVGNEPYAQPAMPEGVREGILRGLYRYQASDVPDSRPHVQLFGSGAILNEVVRAQEVLARYGVGADVWSVTSYSELRREALDVERWNMLHPEQEPRRSYIEEQFDGVDGPVVAATDFMKALPDSIAKWLPRRLVALGTDGFGRSETREALRDFFEVDHRHIAVAALHALLRDHRIERGMVQQAMRDLHINPEKPNPMRV